MNMGRKCGSLAAVAVLLASLGVAASAPPVAAAVSVVSAGTVPVSGSSPGRGSISFTENTAHCFAPTTDALIVTILDSAGNPTVGFVSVGVPSASSSLGITVTQDAARPSELRVSFATADDLQVESFVIDNLEVFANAGAAPGPIRTQVGGFESACVATGMQTAVASLDAPIAVGTNQFIVGNDNSCRLQLTLLGGAGPLTFAGGSEAVAVLSVSTGAYHQSLTTEPVTLAHFAAERVTQEVPASTCGWVELASIGTVAPAPPTPSMDVTPKVAGAGTSLVLQSHWSDPAGLTEVWFNLFDDTGAFVCTLAHGPVPGSPVSYGVAVAPAPLPLAGLAVPTGIPCPAAGLDDPLYGDGIYTVAANWINGNGIGVGGAYPANLVLSSYPAEALDTFRYESAVHDTTPPEANPIASPGENSNGWVNQDVEVTWHWDDGFGSGIDPACPVTTMSTGEGDVTVTSTCSDLAGNVGHASFSTKVDKTDPTVTIDSGPADPTSLTTATFAITTMDALSGLDEVTCSLDGSVFAACPLSYTGLGNGRHEFRVLVTDKAGNSREAAYVWFIEPAVLGMSVTPAVARAGVTLDLTSEWFDPAGLTDVYYNLFDGGGTFVCTIGHVVIGGSPTTATDTTTTAALGFAGLAVPGGIPCPVAGIGDGSYTVAANWVNGAGGQVGDPDNRNLASYPVEAVDTFLYDTTAPTAVPVPSPGENINGWVNQDVEVTWHWTDGSGSGLDPACPVTTMSTGEGNVTVTSTCSDLAGNVGSDSLSMKVDKTDPTVTITASPADPTNQTTALFSFVATDMLSGLDVIECSLDGAPFGPCPPGAYTGLGNGSHTFRVYVSDLAGNSGEAAYTWLIATDAPTIAVTHTADGANGWNVSAPVALAITVTAGPAPVTDVPACLDGATPLTVTGTFPAFASSVTGEGTHAISCTVTDTAGNLSSPGLDEVRIDTVKPVMTPSYNITDTATSVAGLAVDYTVAATDPGAPNASGIAGFACNVPTGSVFPIGTTTVTCIATDVAGNASAPVTFTVTILTARQTKELALTNLQGELATTTNKDTQRKLQEAIKRLQESLAPTLWVASGPLADGVHLDPKNGHRVFDAERAAADQLTKIKNRSDAVEGALARILRADQLIAGQAITDAQARGGDPKKIADAQKHVAASVPHAAKGEVDKAIEKLREAWKRAMDA